MGSSEGIVGGSWKSCVAGGEQGQWGAPYLPGLALVQECSVIDGERSLQGRFLTKSAHFMGGAHVVFNRVASEGT